MAFVWHPAALQNEIITYSPNIQIDEMRDNADWLDDNGCATYNVTVWATYCNSYDNGKQAVNDGAINAVDNGANFGKN